MIPAPWLANSRNNRFILNRYPAAAAYSLRKLIRSSTRCLRVRRSSDNSETDIGYVGKELDQSSLTSFCGAGDGFVTKWYNQMTDGASGNFAQTTAADQPEIVTSGSVLILHSKPVFKFSNSTKNIACDDLTLFKNKDYNRIYFTISKPDSQRLDDFYPIRVLDGSYERFHMRFGSTASTGRDMYCAAIPDNRAMGTPGVDTDTWYMYDDDGSPTQFHSSISTINVMANWNSASSGVPVGSGKRHSKITRHTSDLTTSIYQSGAADQNTVNADATSFKIGPITPGDPDAVGVGYHELIIYSSATYHDNDSDISADIAAYY